MQTWMFVFLLFLSFLALPIQAHEMTAQEPRRVLADLSALKALKIRPLVQDETLNVAIAQLTPKEQNLILDYNHRKGRCGGFELIDVETSFVDNSADILNEYKKRVERDEIHSLAGPSPLTKKQNIENAVQDLKAANLKATVTWLSSFSTRTARASNPNNHVLQLKQKLETLISSTTYAKADLIDHRQTAQKSLRVRLTGRLRPEEIVVIGGHLDSINNSWGRSSEAPGADDNASGSANVLETLRVLLKQGQPERSIEFFWYAAEEGGLIGSSEIARQYKNASKDVIGVLQLDMTLFPGSGELTLGNITDNTSPWLRDLFRQLNNHYIGARIVDDTCGYGCSDHASWYRQGYSTLLPFESTANKINKKIHTASDLINSTSSFNHSLAFSKLALAFAMELGNSTLRN